MSDLTRRKFLTKSSVAVAAAAVAVPGLATALKLNESTAVQAGAIDASESLVVHVRDFASGEISLLVGPDRVIVHDHDLATRLYATARPRR